MAASDLTQEVTMSNQATDKTNPSAFMVCHNVRLIVFHLLLLLTLNVHASNLLQLSRLQRFFFETFLRLFCFKWNLLTTSALFGLQGHFVW